MKQSVGERHILKQDSERLLPKSEPATQSRGMEEHILFNIFIIIQNIKKKVKRLKKMSQVVRMWRIKLKCKTVVMIILKKRDVRRI